MPEALPYRIWSQFFPPKPTFTEAHVADLSGKVAIITGANVGIGKALAQILYSKNATVYMACRTASKAAAAIADIMQRSPESKGRLIHLKLDLSDLKAVQSSAEDFLSRETNLHLLFNNAGVMRCPIDWKTAQGYDQQLGVNAIAPFLFTQLLSPLLIRTASISPPNTVRVIWCSSSSAYLSYKPGGIDLNNTDYHNGESTGYRYSVSKAAVYLHGVEYAKRMRDHGIISIALNPGNVTSGLARHAGWLFGFLTGFILYDAEFGAYTLLWAGCSEKVTLKDSGKWGVPWGRFMHLRSDLEDAAKGVEEGGTGGAKKFWEWTEEQVQPYK